jgi:hypothetical protein
MATKTRRFGQPEKPNSKTNVSAILPMTDHIVTILTYLGITFSSIVTVLNTFTNLHTGIPTRGAIYVLATTLLLGMWYAGFNSLTKRDNSIATRVLGSVMITIAVSLGGVGEMLQAPSPTLTITNPTTNQGLDLELDPKSGAGKFSVHGICQSSSDPALRVYLLLKPEDSSKWYIQQLPVECQKLWTASGWYGSKLHPPKADHTINVRAILAKPEDIGKTTEIERIAELKPVAQSDTVTLPILTVK